MVRRFRREQRCAVGEAVYYLESVEYDLPAAVSMRKKDLEWERQQREAAEAASHKDGFDKVSKKAPREVQVRARLPECPHGDPLQ